MFFLFVCWKDLQNIIFLARTIVKHGAGKFSLQETSAAVEKKLFLFEYKFLPQNKQQWDWWDC